MKCLKSNTNTYSNRKILCPVCKEVIFMSKMIEEILLKSKEQFHEDYEIIIQFFINVDRIKITDDIFRRRTIHIELDRSFFETLIKLGFDLNYKDPFNEIVLEYIAYKDN